MNLSDVKPSLINNILDRTKIMSDKDRRNYITELNNAIEENNILMVFFAGFTEDYSGLKRLCDYKGDSLYFRDKSNKWYDKKFNDIIAIINMHIKNYKKIVMIGQSMGGYAALYCSAFIDNSVCLAFSPQTFNRVGNIILNPNILRNDPPYLTINLRDVIMKTLNNSKKYIFVGTSEFENPNKRFWGDLIFAGYMFNVPNVHLIITHKNVHIIYGMLLFKSLLNVILQNYDILFEDAIKGREILNTQLEYNT
jgi:hypothetical protein